MRRFKTEKFYLAVLLMLGSPLWAETISLEDILEHATKNAVTLKIMQTDALIESKNMEGAEAAYYPTLNAVYNNEYTESLDGIPLGTESIGGITISNGTRYQSSLALQLSYDLYHFGSTDKRVEIASSGFDIKIIEWCSSEKQLHQQILERYASARKASVEKKYRMQMLELRKKLYIMKERLYKAGKYSKVDLGDEAIYMITLERDIKNTSMAYQEDIIRLSELSRKRFSKDMTLLPFNIKTKNISIEDYEGTTEGIILSKKIQRKKDEISLQFREQFPSIGLYSNYYLYSSNPKEYDKAISEIEKKSWNIGLTIKYNIFEGFKNSSNKGRLKLELLRLEQELDEAKHSYIYDVQSKAIKISELKALKEYEQHLLQENYKKREMVNRLYLSNKIDTIAKINAAYELLERTLNIEIREIEASFESASLDILHRGIDQCSRH